jgi:Protein of unknown function (DUF3037)
MKTPYTFVTLRYVHDVASGEFANVGVVLYAPGERYLQARFTASYERLNALFLKIDHAHFGNVMRHLANCFEEMQTEIGHGLELIPVQGIEELVRRVLPPDDSSLQWCADGLRLFGGPDCHDAGAFRAIRGAVCAHRRIAEPDARGGWRNPFYPVRGAASKRGNGKIEIGGICWVGLNR